MSTHVCGCDPEATYHCEHYPNCTYGRLNQHSHPGYRGLGAISRDSREALLGENRESAYTTREERTEAKYAPGTVVPVRSLSPEVVQQFETGATRNPDTHKYDYEGFMSPVVIAEFGRYMHEHRRQRDGSLRASDNWQKGIPKSTYMKSLLRHVIELWQAHRGFEVIDSDSGNPFTVQDLCCAIMFNVMGYLKETIAPATQEQV